MFILHPVFTWLSPSLPLFSPRLVISELQAMLNAVGGPSNIKSNDPNNPYPGLTNFSLLSHGFGNPAINTSLSVVHADVLARVVGFL